MVLFEYSDVWVTGKSKMAAINRKYIDNVVYLSLFTRLLRDSSGYPHIFEVQQHGGTIVDTLRCRRNRLFIYYLIVHEAQTNIAYTKHGATQCTYRQTENIEHTYK